MVIFSTDPQGVIACYSDDENHKLVVTSLVYLVDNGIEYLRNCSTGFEDRFDPKLFTLENGDSLSSAYIFYVITCRRALEAGDIQFNLVENVRSHLTELCITHSFNFLKASLEKSIKSHLGSGSSTYFTYNVTPEPYLKLAPLKMDIKL